MKHIFLGSRVIPLTHAALCVRLGITHMIVSRHQPIDWGEVRDISVLTCDVRDSNIIYTGNDGVLDGVC